MGKAYGLDLDRLKETKQSDPGLMLAYLKSATGVRRVGSDLVRREVATHYATIVKAETIIQQAPRDQREPMRRYLRMLGIKTYPVISGSVRTESSASSRWCSSTTRRRTST